MSDAKPRFVFDRTIQVSTLVAMFGLAAAGIGGILTIYQNFQTQLYDQKLLDALMTQRVETLAIDIKVVKEAVTQIKVEQKETVNALRKSLDSISDDLLKVRISLGGRGRSDLMREQGIRGWADTGTRPIPSPVPPDAQKHEGLE